MAELLKNQFFTEKLFTTLGSLLSKEYPAFDERAFRNLVFDEHWEHKELKQRMRHTSNCLRETLPQDYRAALRILKKVAPEINGFDGMLFPDFVEVYGLDDWEVSVPALHFFTRFSSSEFAVRPFIIARPHEMMETLLGWAGDENHHVRRLASEGCRPRLPWAMALPAFKKDPAPILPILERLKADDSEYVRKSVANNLNDIAKDHPDVLLRIADNWLGSHAHIDWIVKRACRTLLKQGHPEALALFGFGGTEGVKVDKLNVQPSSVRIGESVDFSFVLELPERDLGRIRLEYGVYYMKSNGKQNRKVFQISENHYPAGSHTSFTKTISLKNLTTRKHYPGEHRISVIVNGTELAEIAFYVETGA